MLRVWGFAGVCIVAANMALADDIRVDVITDDDTGEMKFVPAEITIQRGDTVTWINRQFGVHNMSTYPDGFPAGATGFASPLLQEEGERWSHTFTVAGTYDYHCIPHILMQMTGRVIVERTSQPDEQNLPNAADIEAYRDQVTVFFDPEDFIDLPQRVQRNLMEGTQNGAAGANAEE